jgi:hypothetical protein
MDTLSEREWLEGNEEYERWRTETMNTRYDPGDPGPFIGDDDDDLCPTCEGAEGEFVNDEWIPCHCTL